MKYAILSRGDQFSACVIKELHRKLHSIGFNNDQHFPEVVFTIGGDGTMLKAVHKYINRIENTVFVGIHTGKLGFYTDFVHNEIDTLIKQIQLNQYTDVKFPLLETRVCNDDGSKHFFALNEITLINSYHTQHLEVFINDEYFESFQGTGLCISTPSGSSAYNKSLGGALLHPKIKAFQLTEMASINSRVYRTISSPMIFPKEHYITLKSKSFNEVTITVDHMHKDLQRYHSIICSLSDKSVTFRQFRKNDFWKRVQKSFL